jgi:hypothetical protein
MRNGSRTRARTMRATEKLVSERSVLMMRATAYARPRHLRPSLSDDMALRDGFYDYRDLDIHVS